MGAVETSRGLGTVRISIVEDDQPTREALESLMRSLGFAALAFRSAEEFLESPETQATECLILDLHLPGMSGLELQSKLVAANCRLPILFITAHGDQAIRERAIQGGAVDLLDKPVRWVALLDGIRSALERSRLAPAVDRGPSCHR
jgi:FixJ family two-component response regulator